MAQRVVRGFGSIERGDRPSQPDLLDEQDSDQHD